LSGKGKAWGLELKIRKRFFWSLLTLLPGSNKVILIFARNKVMKFIPLILFTISCSTIHSFNKDRILFEASKEILKFKSVSDLNDSYFVIKENNFFEFYRLLFDSVKNSSFPGKFIKEGDTMLLRFYNKEGETLLGKKALITENKKEVIFFDHYPGIKKKLIIP